MLLMAFAFAAAACHRGANDAAKTNVQTQTIAPAAAQPAPNGNDAMTQTVDVEDSRSVAADSVGTSRRCWPPEKITEQSLTFGPGGKCAGQSANGRHAICSSGTP